MEKVIRENSDLREVKSCDLDVVWNAVRSRIAAAARQVFPRYDCVPELPGTNRFETTELILDVSEESHSPARTPSEPYNCGKRTRQDGTYQDLVTTVEVIEEDAKELDAALKSKPCEGLNVIGQLSDFVAYSYGATEWSEDAEMPRSMRIVLHDADNFRQVTVLARGLLRETWQLPEEPAKPLRTLGRCPYRLVNVITDVIAAKKLEIRIFLQDKGRFHVINEDVPFLFRHKTFPVREDGEIVFTEEVEDPGSTDIPWIGPTFAEHS